MLKLKTSAATGEQSNTPQSGTENNIQERRWEKLLIVDDERDLLKTLETLFSPHYTVRTADSGAQALEIIQGGFVPQVILADQRMPGMSGTEFLGKSIALVPQTVRVVLTGYTDVQDLTDSINQGNVYRFLTKPWRNADLLEIIRACFDHYHLSEEKIALTKALQRLQSLNTEKTELLEILAHDLRNPLNAIMGLGEMLQNGKELGLTDSVMHEMGKEICHSSVRMLNLMNNLLSIHAIESGQMEFALGSLSVVSSIDFSVKEFRPRAAAKNITLHSSIADDAIILADETVFQQILENLLSNAVKYSPRGKNIWVRAERTGDIVRISVQDEGPGVLAEEIGKLFEKFSKLSARPTGGEDSTGLGLSIVKRLTEAMKGQIWCESAEGNGATFIVEFPVHMPSPASLPLSLPDIA